MTALPSLSLKTARALFLDRSALSGAATDLPTLIDRLGFVQIDSINTVARAHHMILQARRPSYRARDIHRFHDQDRGVFEHWTHDASMIAMAHYPHWKLKFRRHLEKSAARRQKWREEGVAAKMDAVLQHIADHGPCCSADVGTDEPRSSGGWWDWHPSKIALEHFWRIGVLSVVRRDGFRKVYDLTENVIPEHVRAQTPDESDTIDWACRSALNRLGFATSGELAAFWDLITPAEARAWVQTGLKDQTLIEVTLPQADGRLRKSVMWPETLDTTPAPPSSRLRVMSPFDPALRDRKRTERLFDFHYRIEVFVPAPKRIYGYYVFPILEGDRLIGRIDMKAHRDRDCLHVTALWPEPGVQLTKARLAKLDTALARTARLAEVSEISFAPDWQRAPIHPT